MASISSKKMIEERARIFWYENRIWETDFIISDLELIHYFLANEYRLIPNSERIGKGSVFITKIIADATIALLVKSNYIKPLETINLIFHFPVSNDNHMKNYALALLSGFSYTSKQAFQDSIEFVKIIIDNIDWEIREQCGIVIRRTLKKFPKETLSILYDWINSPSENLRRLSIESTRPLRDINWLRNPIKNDSIIYLLDKLKTDNSLYVRKSVGNNLKDLTKYMPEKILKLISNWLDDAKIKVTDDLASKNKKELGEKNYNLVWTIKFALRWLKEREPKYHDEIKQLLGENYLLYYDEKNNKMAIKK